MYCKRCGAEISDNARFCEVCGLSVSQGGGRTQEETEEFEQLQLRNERAKNALFIIIGLAMSFVGTTLYAGPVAGLISCAALGLIGIAFAIKNRMK